MKYKSRKAVENNLKRMFSLSPEDDVIALEKAFRAWGRPNPEDVEGNKTWLSTELTHFKYHNLLVPIYSFSEGRKKLAKLQLTLEGKRVLGRVTDQNKQSFSHEGIKQNNNSNDISFSDVMKMVAQLRKNHPDYEIVFDVKLKNE